MNKYIKYFMFILVMCSAIFAASFPQNNGESSKKGDEVVDIRAMIQKDIDEARKKQTELVKEKEASALIKTNNNSVNVSDAEGNSVTYFIYGIDNRIIILVSASIILTLFISFSRIRAAKRNADADVLSLKQKIAMIRNEDPIVNTDEEISEVRKNLRYATMIYDRNENNDKNSIVNVNSNHSNGKTQKERRLSITARQLQIAKGELLLASKIRELEMDSA